MHLCDMCHVVLSPNINRTFQIGIFQDGKFDVCTTLDLCCECASVVPKRVLELAESFRKSFRANNKAGIWTKIGRGELPSSIDLQFGHDIKQIYVNRSGTIYNVIDGEDKTYQFSLRNGKWIRNA